MNHLTDRDIQEYAEGHGFRHLEGDFPEGNTKFTDHLAVCGRCRKEVDQYRALFHALERSPGWELSGNFAKTVIGHLPRNVNSRRFTMNNYSLAISIIVIIAGVLAYFIDISLLLDFFSPVFPGNFKLNFMSDIIAFIPVRGKFHLFTGGIMLLFVAVFDYYILQRKYRL
ncbi:hypothetical protein ACFL6I_01415 [candidate division KSB1 bacterium]